MALNLDEINAYTMAILGPRIADNIFRSSPLQEYTDGQIADPVKYSDFGFAGASYTVTGTEAAPASSNVVTIDSIREAIQSVQPVYLQDALRKMNKDIDAQMGVKDLTRLRKQAAAQEPAPAFPEDPSRLFSFNEE